jgi:formate hydrogenlyase subunit 3/multisubunit Na+/H+ antiporter MnhD subunit
MHPSMWLVVLPFGIAPSFLVAPRRWTGILVYVGATAIPLAGFGLTAAMARNGPIASAVGVPGTAVEIPFYAHGLSAFVILMTAAVPQFDEMWSGMSYQMLSHALSKASLFLWAGAIAARFGSDHMSFLNGLSSRTPETRSGGHQAVARFDLVATSSSPAAPRSYGAGTHPPSTRATV